VQFMADKAFFDRVQSTFPEGTAFFELPYVYFPESPKPPSSYALFEPYLLTEDFAGASATCVDVPQTCGTSRYRS
jgi:hypothetical protein